MFLNSVGDRYISFMINILFKPYVYDNKIKPLQMWERGYYNENILIEIF